MLVTKQLLVDIDCHSMERNTMKIKGYQQLCVQWTEIINNVLEQHEGE